MAEFTEFAPHTGIDWNGPDVGMVKYGGDNNVVLFYNKSVPDPVKSAEVGRQYNVDKVYVRIHPPGERLNIIDRPATRAEFMRYPHQYAQFKQQAEQTSDGTPIDLLYPTHPAVAANLRASGVHTIEQCAALSGPAIDQIGMGAQHYCNDAAKYLEAAQKGVHHTHMRHELEQRDGEIRTLKQQVDMLKAQLDKVSNNQNQQFTMEQMMNVFAQRMGQFPPVGVQPSPVFDAQAAQIAATDPRREIVTDAAKRRGRPRKV